MEDKPTIKITKCTDESLVRLAASYTMGRESKITLKRAYKSEHSIIRTQLFAIESRNIPLFVSTHLIRHHVGSQPFQLTCREDLTKNPTFKAHIDTLRDEIVAGDIDKAVAHLEWIESHFDRYTPVNLLIFANAQSLIDMAKLRLCFKASVQTREWFGRIKEELKSADPDLYPYLVPKCVYRGGICCEPKCCGYNKTDLFKKALDNYKLLFVD